MMNKILIGMMLFSFCLSQQKTKTIVYGTEIKGAKIQNGADFVFMGLEFKNPLVSWSYDSDDRGDIFFNDFYLKSRIKDFINKLPAKFRSFVLFQPDKEDTKAYKKGLGHIASDFIAYPFRETPLLDNDASGEFLEDSITDFLDEHVSSKYYGVIVLSVPFMEHPHIINKFSFTLDTQISFILYDRSGKKVLVRNFKRHFQKMDIKNLSYKRPDVYWENFLAILDENKQAINTMVNGWGFKNKKAEKNILIKDYFDVQ